MKNIHFVNLTNGLQAIKDYKLEDYRFMRLQSTACEQKKWMQIIDNLSEELLLHLAVGNNCIVYDYGADKRVPRSVWQGLEFIKFVLNKKWLGKEYQLEGRMKQAQKYFDIVYHNLPARSFSKIKYFGRYLNTKDINLSAVTSSSRKDNNLEYFKSFLLNAINQVHKKNNNRYGKLGNPDNECKAYPVAKTKSLEQVLKS